MTGFECMMLQAADRADMQIKLYAVEKNPNAIVHIQNLLQAKG